MENADGKGGKIQLAQQKDTKVRSSSATRSGSSTSTPTTSTTMHKAALDFGCEETTRRSVPSAGPITISFVKDPDGYVVEFVQRHPWQDGDDTTQAWVGQHCIYVTDIDATKKFCETLGMTMHE